MKALNTFKYIIAIIAIIFIFFSWKISLLLFVIASIAHAFPLGPYMLLNTLAGYSLIGGILYLFVSWKIGAVLIICSILIVKFRAWTNSVNVDYYKK